MNRLKISLLLAACSSLALLVACGGSSSSTQAATTTSPTPTSSGSNVASISVDGGPLGDYSDAAFVSVTVCAPGTSTCQTIDNVLVDTGSSGLRILSSALTIALTQQTASSGEPVVECLPFVSGYTWGAVQTADVEMASEKASSVPIQVLSDTDYTTPTACQDQGQSSDTLENLGANGIVGVGLFVQDCGSYCTTVQSGSFNPYYTCSSSTTCQPVGEPLAQQVTNPVSLFATDNNGVIVELPSLSGGEEASATGSLVFGIGTESNNALGSATIYTANDGGNFTTTFNGTTFPGTSFIDSGSNGYFFPDTSITQCGNDSEAPGFYCPSSTLNLSASNTGENNASGTVDFSIANAITLFNSDDNAFSELGGTYATQAFDWGLPFFFGRYVYVGLQNSTYTYGYWAY